mmetsp:Transcript_8633/g.16729  ORF Transcript_8633/g.16729 Transcript_8633/m.16729 type:complete len:155 (-) Transcript_8633:88-552(-)
MSVPHLRKPQMVCPLPSQMFHTKNTNPSGVSPLPTLEKAEARGIRGIQGVALTVDIQRTHGNEKITVGIEIGIEVGNEIEIGVIVGFTTVRNVGAMSAMAVETNVTVKGIVVIREREVGIDLGTTENVDEAWMITGAYGRTEKNHVDASGGLMC